MPGALGSGSGSRQPATQSGVIPPSDMLALTPRPSPVIGVECSETSAHPRPISPITDASTKRIVTDRTRRNRDAPPVDGVRAMAACRGVPAARADRSSIPPAVSTAGSARKILRRLTPPVGICQGAPFASYTTVPPTTVITFFVCRISGSGIVMMSRSSTVKSARFPTVMLPARSSSNAAYAA